VLLLPFCFLVLLYISGELALARDFAVSVTATSTKIATPGEIVTHVFTISNLGKEDDLYILDLETPEGWDYFPEQASFFLRAGKRGYLFVNLIVPQFAIAGKYDVRLTVSSSNDPTVWAKATTHVEVLPYWDFTLRWLEPLQRAQVGQKAVWRFLIMNTGNVPDAYVLELATYGEWKVRLSAREVQLLPGEEKILEIRAEVPPHAEPGSGYSLRLIATSTHDFSLSRELRLSGRFLPPPPELVRKSLYPQWDVAATLEVDSSGNPELTLRGWGDIELFNFYVDTSASVAQAELSDLRLSWTGGGKSFYLHGGSISGVLLGVSGKPLFGGEVEGFGTWRALYTKDAKGISLTGNGDDFFLGFVWAGDSAEGFAFQELNFNWDLSRNFSMWGLISQGTATEIGYAWRVGGKFSGTGHQLAASFFQVSRGYPRQSPRNEFILTGESTLDSFSLVTTYRFSSFSRESPPGELVSHELRVSIAPRVYLRPRLDVNYVHRWDFPAPQSVNERSVSFRASLRGASELSWNISLSSSFKEDFVLEKLSGSLVLSGGFNLTTEFAEFSFGAEVSATFGDGAPAPSSSLQLRARLPRALGSPSLSFSAAEGETTLSLAARNIPVGEGRADWSWEYTVEEGKSSWEASFSLSFPADFPFLGPTRGRIAGHIFIDRDGDLAFGPQDEGVEGVLLEADGREALSGKDGFFIFPPLLPGVYRITLSEPLPELAPARPLPSVEVVRGQEVTVEIPLRPRAWLKGFVFQDADKDGEYDPGEAGIPGVKVTVSGEDGEWTVETDQAGLFSLELPSGQYEVGLVEESLPERFVLTTPTPVKVEVPEYGTAEVRFGAYRKPKPVVITFAPPVAKISYTPERPKAGEEVEFDGSGSQAFNATIVSFRWEFRLGERRITAEGERVKLSFPEPGRWVVILIVTDSAGRIGAAQLIVEIFPEKG